MPVDAELGQVERAAQAGGQRAMLGRSPGAAVSADRSRNRLSLFTGGRRVRLRAGSELRPAAAPGRGFSRCLRLINDEQLEQLNRIAVRIFNLNLFAAGAYLHFISKTQTGLFQVSDARRQILHVKEYTVPSAGLLLTAIRHWSGPRCPRTAQD